MALRGNTDMALALVLSWYGLVGPARAADGEPKAPAAEVHEAAVPAPPLESKPAAAANREQEVAALEAEFAQIMDELAQARTRTAVLARTLFRTPIEVRLVRRADDQRIAHLTLRLDGVAVHDSDGSALTSGEAVLFEGYAAPGLHELTVEIREQSKEKSSYSYVRSERFRIEIKKDTRTQVEFVLRDDSNMAVKLPAGKTGEYDVRTLMRVRTESVND